MLIKQNIFYFARNTFMKICLWSMFKYFLELMYILLFVMVCFFHIIRKDKLDLAICMYTGNLSF